VIASLQHFIHTAAIWQVCDLLMYIITYSSGRNYFTVWHHANSRWRVMQ